MVEHQPSKLVVRVRFPSPAPNIKNVKNKKGKLNRLKKWQKRINPFWGLIAGGGNIDRKIPDLIQESGFDIVEMEEMYLPNTPKIAGYNYWGYAVSKQ